ncbi:MAG TPA: nicotinate-nucleotide adenylyltransferase [Chthoniobacteraceae bacterium]|nr:nicotinate-nucleotide adenylyltransferase [Chthoniobacteraceae bacterium]
MRIGIYGGTFDPVHNGHLILARDAVEKLGLDEIVFIPNAVPPHRAGEKRTPEALRFEMVAAAVAGETRFKADDVEIRRGGVSYTIDTILALKEKYAPGDAFYFLVGGDNVRELSSWHRIEELKKLVTFVALSRGDCDNGHLTLQLERRVDISATEIRARVAKNLSIRYLVPDAVLEIITRNQLYKE